MTFAVVFILYSIVELVKGKKNYLPIVTGHQGEPNAILTRIANGYALEIKLKMAGARIYENVHVSGHASREDHWEVLRLVNPDQVIPSHGNMVMHSHYVELAEEAGYVFGDTVHIMRNGEEMVL